MNAQMKPAGNSLTEAELLSRLEALVPALRERAQETERLRHIPQATFDDAKRSGYLSAFRTRHFGGPGLGLSALANGARILAHGCASSAWTLVFLAQHTWMFAKANLQLQTELLAGEFPGMQAGSLGKLGVARPVEGGYRVTATSDWNSGIMQSTWVNCKAKIEGDEQVMMVVMPVADVKVQDVWHTAGLRGTGSNTIVVDNVFVPAHRLQPAAEFMGEKAHPVHDAEPFASYPFVPVVTTTISAIALGIAEAAVQEFKAIIEKRTLAFSGGQKQSDQPFAQMRLGEAVGELRAIQTLCRGMLNDIVNTYEPRQRMTTAERVGVRLTGATIVRACRRLLDDCIMPNAGGSSYFESSPLQRMQRDLEVLKGHAMFDWDRLAQLAGRVELGQAPAPTDLL